MLSTDSFSLLLRNEEEAQESIPWICDASMSKAETAFRFPYVNSDQPRFNYRWKCMCSHTHLYATNTFTNEYLKLCTVHLLFARGTIDCVAMVKRV